MQPVVKRGGGTGVGVNAVVWSSRPETLIWGMDGGEVRQMMLDLHCLAAAVACERGTSMFVHAGEKREQWV
jgi:hypothetical protein